MSTTITRPIYESHPSVDASMEDFEFRANSPEFLRPDSHARIHFMSPTASDYSEAATQPDVDGGWSPPAWRKAGSGWFKHHLQQTGLMSPYGSRECSPEEYRKGLTPYDDDDEDILVAAGIPLPISPLKGRSPEPSYSPTVAAVLKQDEDRRRQLAQSQKEGEQSWPDKHDNCTHRRVIVLIMTADQDGRYPFFRSSRRTTAHRTHRSSHSPLPQALGSLYQESIHYIPLTDVSSVRADTDSRLVFRTRDWTYS